MLRYRSRETKDGVLLYPASSSITSPWHIFNLREQDYKHFRDDIYCESYGENPIHFHDEIIQVLAKILNILRMAMIMKITEKVLNIM